MLRVGTCICRRTGEISIGGSDGYPATQLLCSFELCENGVTLLCLGVEWSVGQISASGWC